jgi:hypothetical protein
MWRKAGDRGTCRYPHRSGVYVGGVVVAGLVRVKDLGEGGQCGVGDYGGDGGLVLVLAPHNRQVGRGEQAGFEGGRQSGEDVAEVGDFCQYGGIYGPWPLGGQGG